MAKLNIEGLLGPVALGVVSAGGEVMQLNRQYQKTVDPTKNKDNFLFDNAGLIADVVAGGYAIANHVMDLKMPRKDSSELMASGVTILTRRVANLIGMNVLGITSTPTKKLEGGAAYTRYNANSLRLSSPGAYPALGPGAAVEVSAPGVLGRRFYSIT